MQPAKHPYVIKISCPATSGIVAAVTFVVNASVVMTVARPRPWLTDGQSEAPSQ